MKVNNNKTDKNRLEDEVLSRIRYIKRLQLTQREPKKAGRCPDLCWNNADISPDISPDISLDISLDISVVMLSY